jgi:hypothetical protein
MVSIGVSSLDQMTGCGLRGSIRSKLSIVSPELRNCVPELRAVSPELRALSEVQRRDGSKADCKAPDSHGAVRDSVCNVGRKNPTLQSFCGAAYLAAFVADITIGATATHAGFTNHSASFLSSFLGPRELPIPHTSPWKGFAGNGGLS